MLRAPCHPPPVAVGLKVSWKNQPEVPFSLPEYVHVAVETPVAASSAVPRCLVTRALFRLLFASLSSVDRGIVAYAYATATRQPNYKNLLDSPMYICCRGHGTTSGGHATVASRVA
jgi:hypothetical protein